jgi:hypothetical protein
MTAHDAMRRPRSSTKEGADAWPVHARVAGDSENTTGSRHAAVQTPPRPLSEVHGREPASTRGTAVPNDYEPLWVASQGAALPQESIAEHRTRRHDADAKDRPEAEGTGGGRRSDAEAPSSQGGPPCWC